MRVNVLGVPLWRSVKEDKKCIMKLILEILH
jgi:hypothetical protein